MLLLVLLGLAVMGAGCASDELAATAPAPVQLAQPARPGLSDPAALQPTAVAPTGIQVPSRTPAGASPDAAPRTDPRTPDYPVEVAAEDVPVQEPVLRLAPPPAVGQVGATALRSADGAWEYRLVDRAEDTGTALVAVEVATGSAGDAVALTRTLPAVDMALTPDGRTLMVAATTHTLVVDLTVPGTPVLRGRVSDYMVRNHVAVDIHQVIGIGYGERTLMTITSRLNGGSGCPTGTVHLYDITGELADRPLMITDSDVAQVPLDDGRPCTEHGTLSLDRVTRGVVVSWEGSDRLEWSPYDTTPAYLASAQYCVLVPASGPA